MSSEKTKKVKKFFGGISKQMQARNTTGLSCGYVDNKIQMNYPAAYPHQKEDISTVLDIDEAKEKPEPLSPGVFLN